MLRKEALLLQLERHAEERLDEKWRALEKRAKKEAKKEGYVPPQERPEASFIASLVEEFVEVSPPSLPRRTVLTQTSLSHNSTPLDGYQGCSPEARRLIVVVLWTSLSR